jgi:PAS domain S-box-containing protein
MRTALAPANYRVLVVDDSTAIHDDFRKVLKRRHQEVDEFEVLAFGKTAASAVELDFEVEFASQGKQAWEMVQRGVAAKRPYAMAFMDVQMPPGWNGVETTAKIWEVDPDLQIVICTAYSDYAWDDMITRLGRSDRLVILKKPFDSVEVLQLANALTEKWRLLQESRLTVLDLEQTVQERTREVQESHAEMEMLLASITAAIIGVDTEQKVTRWNRAAEILFSISSETALGQPIESLAWKLDWERVHRALDECRRGRVAVELPHVPYARADGKDGFINLSLTPNRSGGKQGLDVVLLGADTTAHRLLESQLRQAQKLEAIGQLAAGIAHEINTPTQYVGDNTRFLQTSFTSIAEVLRAYEGLVDAARNNAISPELILEVRKLVAANDLAYLFEQIPAAIAETLEGVERITRIVGAMKDFSHPGGEGIAPADLNKAIETTVTVARSAWKYVADMELALDPGLPPVPCFVAEFNQCILNLIVNAAHAIEDVVKLNPGSKGKINIHTSRDGAYAEIRVSDTGTGIPVAVRPKIFEPFFTTKGVGKGTGQGLYLAYQTVTEKHQGKISFETETGKGTTFLIRLPLRAATVAPQTHSTTK